jgi:GT2 family glycosyltransferase
MICSDSDFCFRIRLAGYTVWYEPESVVLHHLGASNKGKNQLKPEMLKILQRDQKRFFDKWSKVTGCYQRDELDQAINNYINNIRSPQNGNRAGF